jgi:hypothetical protein
MQISIGLRIRIRIIFRSWIGSAIERKVGSISALKSNFRSFRGSKWGWEEPWMLTMEA